MGNVKQYWFAVTAALIPTLAQKQGFIADIQD
jgi:hypothetical protein